jgi:hypothetical protein
MKNMSNTELIKQEAERILDNLKEVKNAFKWTWDNQGTPHTPDHFNTPANGIELLIEVIDQVKSLCAQSLQRPGGSDGSEAVGFAEWTQCCDLNFSFNKGTWIPYPYTRDSPRYTTEQLYQLYKQQP